MIVTAFVPLVLLLVIITLIYLFVKNIGRVPLLQKLKLKWILAIYGSILLAALIFSYLLPVGKSVEYQTVSDTERDLAEKAGEMLVKAAYNRKNISEENIAGVNIKNESTIPFEGKQLELSVEDTYGPITILVERKLENDNEIEYIEFETRTIIENLDLSEEIGPISVTVQEDLRIMNSDFEDINIGMFDKEFTISQFTSDEGFELFDDSHHVWGEHVLFLRIPKDLELVDKYDYVQYVTE